ncbi:MAG: hypothetical protein ABJB55_01545 [Actinomycetota bacterium]
MGLPEDAVELFRFAPERFVAARDALVRRLRDEGRDDDAAAVKALRKPTAVVWALNQLAVRDPDALATLFEAGRDLRSAQQTALAGKPSGAEELRAAATARRDAVARSRNAAIAILDEAGHRGAGQADVLTSALETASTDMAIGASLASGTLEKAPAVAAGLGFGDMPSIAVLPGGSTDPVPRSASTRTGVARLRKERDATRKAATGRRATADRLARQVADARVHLEQLERDHAAAESEALAAETEAERAERRHT